MERTYDVAIVGAGPVGLALAIELSRNGLATIVLDRRPPLTQDASARPQLLVARTGDLAHLAHLGVDIDDETLVSILATRTERDAASGRSITADVVPLRSTPERPRDLWELAAQTPRALIPIGRLQAALLARARTSGADVVYGCEVTRLRRHAREVSLVCASGVSIVAGLAIIATGAGRSSITSILRGLDAAPVAPRLIAGVLSVGGDRGRWVRAEVPSATGTPPLRCTLLQTASASGAGTALLVDPQLAATAGEEQLLGCFEQAARALGVAGAPYRVAPLVFATGVTTATRRFVAGDNRAPVVIAGDAAQTGHVFSGQTCFVNVALALGLAEQLARARRAITERAVSSPSLARALATYERQSEAGAALLALASRRHHQRHAPGAWALASVARA